MARVCTPASGADYSNGSTREAFPRGTTAAASIFSGGVDGNILGRKEIINPYRKPVRPIHKIV